MKKILVVLLALSLVSSMAFAQFSISGIAVGKGGFSLPDGGPNVFDFADDGSRLEFAAKAADGKAGGFADLRFVGGVTGVGKAVYFNQLYGWVKPVQTVKLQFGWYEYSDLNINDKSWLKSYDGKVKNTAGSIILDKNIAALADFYLMNNALTVTASVAGQSYATLIGTYMKGYLGVQYAIPSFGKVVVEGDIPFGLSEDDKMLSDSIADFFRASATVQFAPTSAFDAAVGFKVAGKAFNQVALYNLMDAGLLYMKDINTSVILIANYQGIAKFRLNAGLELLLTNGMGLTNIVSVGYDFGFVIPRLGAYGFTSFDKEKRNFGTEDKTGGQFLGIDFEFPIAKSGGFVVGAYYGTHNKSFNIPMTLELKF